MQHRDGYTYVWTGKGSPFLVGDQAAYFRSTLGEVLNNYSESWEIECLPAKADAHPVGFTRIDGHTCTVFRTTEGGYLAQLTEGRLTPAGPKQPSLFKD